MSQVSLSCMLTILIHLIRLQLFHTILSEASQVELSVYDMRGRKIKIFSGKVQNAGRYMIHGWG